MAQKESMFYAMLMGMMLCLSACNPFGWGRVDNQTMLMRGWNTPDPMTPPEPLHCYRTLGEKMCYRAPQAEKNNQLVGEYTPYEPPHKKDFLEKLLS